MTELWDVLDETGRATGRTAPRGPLGPGEYHLVVHVWTVNSRGDFLISRRTPNKTFPGMWETTGGSALAGEDSLTAALREVREEMGVALRPENGRLFRRLRRSDGHGTDFADVWFFRQEVNLADVVFQPEETDGALLVSAAEICRMIDEGRFVGREIFYYIDELFAEEARSREPRDLRVSDLLRMQRSLYEHNRAKWSPLEPKYARNSILWMMEELGEAISLIKKRGEADIMADLGVRGDFVEELADVSMYFHDILMRYKVTPEEFSAAYLQKHAKNMGRDYTAEYKNFRTD